MNDSDSFHLKVRSREGVEYEGEIDSISSYNESGKFDVLSKHANFISLIQKSVIIRLLTGETRQIDVSLALMRVRENNVEVYLGVEGIKESHLKASPEIEL